MNKRFIGRATAAFAIGHIASLLFLLLAAFAILNMPHANDMLCGAGIAAVIIGAIVAGLASRAFGTGSGGAFAVGFAFAFSLALLSFTLQSGDGVNSLPVGTRLGVFSAAALICGLISVIPVKRKPRYGTQRAKDAVNRYISGKTGD